jgi:SWI/SNF-related matrix-associated actin-dependent regulator of chromatin subfamily D
VGTTGSLAGGASAGTGSAAAAAVRPPKRRSIGERVKEIVPESRLLNELMEAEARLETVAWRRQQAALEAVRVKSTRGQRTIRIIMSSRFSTPGPAYQLDEPTSAGAGGSGDPTPPHWIFRLEAHLLPLAGEATLRAGAASTGRARFSQLLRRVVVEDESGQVAEWERGRGHAGEIDGIELKRRGDREAQLRVLVWPDQGPPRYRLSADLAQLLGMASETRPRVLMALWQYVKLHRLQDPEDRKAIRCNPELARVLGAERVPFASLPLLVAEHLSPPEPVELRFTLTRPDGPHPHPHPDAVAEQAYDLLLDLEEPPQPLGAALRREIDALDDALSAHLTRLHELKLRRDFFLSFAFQPSRFLATLLHQQTRDYILMRSEATGRDPEEERHSSYYLQPLALDAVQQLCNASASASASTVPAPAPAPPPALPLPVLH